ncbi:mRNA turnover protein 4 [Xylariomycetidae sp. FL0641]|nr:mRNA turnover protein 4 [Xylariomycetidae sp. FL0641]
MPKSKRAKVVHTTQVNKKNREHKERLFESIRDCLGEYQYCYVIALENERNKHIQEVRQELSDSRLFFGKTKLMARALGHGPEDSAGENTWKLTRHLRGTVGLLFTPRAPGAVLGYLAALAPVDFARAGAVAPRAFVVPPGPLGATGGAVPPDHDVAVGPALEPELRRLGLPTRLVRGRVVLEGDLATGHGYTVCRAGDTLDARQARLLRLFDACMSEFRVRVRAYWAAATGEVTELAPEEDEMEGVEGEGSD